MSELIQSPANPRIKNLVRLRQGTHRRRQGRFLIEGTREVARALRAGLPIEELYLCPELTPESAPEHPDETLSAIEETAHQRGVLVFPTAPDAFAKASQREGPDGVLAVAPMPAFALGKLPPDATLVLVVERVEKPGNLGTLIRTADGAGADAVVIADPVTDLANPNLIRASQGACFGMPLASGTSQEVATWVLERNLQLVAATPEGALPWADVDYRPPTAILLGSESEGLSAFWLERARLRVVLPMRGLGDSLNVSATGAVLLYEARRQRG